jgi:predicted kinase
MRDWMRDLMRRRPKRGVNNSESTGKIGQEIPVNQPAPLQPSYGSDAPASARSAAPSAPATQSDPEHLDPRQARAFDADFSPLPEIESGEPETLEAENEAAEIEAAPNGASFASSEPAAAAEGKLVHELQPESPSVPPPEPQAAGQKVSRGFVVLAIGLPGSGKTTWFKRRGVTPLSSDMLRSILFDDITEQRYQGLVFSTLRSLLRARLIAKMPWNYVDATNLSPHERRQWIKMAKSFGYEVQAVFFDVPFEVCMERNQKRERTVSDETMRKMAERLRPPNFKEGFGKITVVRVKGSAPTADPIPEAAPATE